MIKTDQPWPSVYSSSKKLVVNQDGSIDVWFGPNAPVGKESNWIRTIPEKRMVRNHASLRSTGSLDQWNMEAGGDRTNIIAVPIAMLYFRILLTDIYNLKLF